MAIAAQTVALLLTEHARDPFAGPVLAYGKQSTNIRYDGALWMFEALGLAPHPDGLLDPPPGDAVIDLARFIKLLGLGELQTLDVAGLNAPVAAGLIGHFGLILDGEALGDVFDIRQGMMNTAGMLRPGGRVAHVAAVNNYVNRGFAQFSPTLFHDYYTANAFEDVRGTIIVRPREGSDAKRWHFVPYDHDTMGGVNSMFCSGDTQLAVYYTARKGAASTSDRVPMQSYFTRLSEHRDLMPHQFVITHDKDRAKVRLIDDPEPRPVMLAPFSPIWRLDLQPRPGSPA